jgi:Lrp/AsnC family transcriptional regulator for asnA, asnC and gidA
LPQLPATVAALDSLDRQILRLLRDDGRRPNAEIARAAGSSEPTVRKRLDRLRDLGVLRVIGLLNPAATGFPVDVLIGIVVAHGKAKEIGRRLASMNCVAFVGYTTGVYDIVIEAVFADTLHLLDFLGASLGAVGEITSTETFHVLATDKFNYMWELPDPELPPLTPPATPPPRPDEKVASARRTAKSREAKTEIDALDRHILRLLRDDGRRPNSEIARAIGLSENAVRKRLDRLRETGVLRIIGLLDPPATGFPVYAMIGLRVRPGTAQLVGRRLAQMDCVAYVGYTSGRYDLFTEAMLASNRALSEFLHGSLGTIDGILSTEAFHVLEIEKFNYMWDLPDPEEESAPRVLRARS